MEVRDVIPGRYSLEKQGSECQDSCTASNNLKKLSRKREKMDSSSLQPPK
jgi:hypothetical protein